MPSAHHIIIIRAELMFGKRPSGKTIKTRNPTLTAGALGMFRCMCVRAPSVPRNANARKILRRRRRRHRRRRSRFCHTDGSETKRNQVVQAKNYCLTFSPQRFFSLYISPLSCVCAPVDKVGVHIWLLQWLCNRLFVFFFFLHIHFCYSFEKS